MEDTNNMVFDPPSPETENEPMTEEAEMLVSPGTNLDPKIDANGLALPENGVEAKGAETVVKKKRGRPKKYSIDGYVGDDGKFVAVVSTPVVPPPVVPPPPGFSSPYSEGSAKRGRGRPKGSGKLQLLAKGGFPLDPAGEGLHPHVVIAEAGEEIYNKIGSLSQRLGRSLCVLSATGIVSSVLLLQTNAASGILRHKGRFQILTLSGSFICGAKRNAQEKNGMLSITLALPDGNVFGGTVAGALVAAEPVQIIVGSFKTDTGKGAKKRPSAEPSACTTSTAAGNSDLVIAPVPLLMDPPMNHDLPPTNGNDRCNSPTSGLLEYPAHSGEGNLIAANHNMNPTSLSVYGNNVMQPMPDRRTSPVIDPFDPLT